MKKFLFLGLIFLSIQCSYAEDHEPTAVGPEPAPHLALQAASTAVTIPLEDENKPKITWKEHLLCWTRGFGGAGEVLGTMTAAAGAVLALSDLQNVTKASGIMLTVGLFLKSGGNVFTTNAERRAAEFEAHLDGRVKKITDVGLSKEEVQALSDRFYEELGCEKIIGCAAYFDDLTSRTCAFFALPVSATGFVLSQCVGYPILGACFSAAGGSMWELRDFFAARAEKKAAQLKRMAAIEEANSNHTAVTIPN